MEVEGGVGAILSVVLKTNVRPFVNQHRASFEALKLGSFQSVRASLRAGCASTLLREA